MNMAIAGFLLIIIVLFIWLNSTYKKKLATVDDELRFFKKEKEYYSEAMMVYSKDREIVFANKAAKTLFSLEKEKNVYLLKSSIELKIANAEPMEFFEAIERKSNATQESFEFKDIILIVNGKKRVVTMYVDRSAWNVDGTVTCVIEMQSTSGNQTAKSDGKVDFLTGMASQFTSLSDINALVIDSQKKSESFALFLLGIDHFSDIQTTLGQAYSNNILKNMANYFKENPDENRKVYRMDCDKFLLVIKHVDDDETARKVSRKLMMDIGNYFKGDANTRLTVSFGVARYPQHGENATKLINHAYIALDKGQKDSVSNIELFSNETQVVHKDEVRMNEEIISALKNKEFLLYYQPVFNLKEEKMVGAEALIRWNHPKMGLVSPDKFLKVAEKTGLIVDIGEYVFREAMKQRKQWDELGFNKFKITLNLSLREMQVDELIKKLSILFEEYAVDPLDFNLDITEEDAMSSIDKTAIDFALFKELGLSISLDHFGAGYSSLKHLQMLPLSMLKIDRSLIFDLASNLDHQTAVKGIVNLAHTLGYEVVAEGVETSKEVKILNNLNCDHAQGYLFSRPLPVFEFQELLR
ncbi:MAG TPA: bifunctional diguanylate cyclase/phosphodiesterase [Sulfurovum sp.]|nr:bifunctional diguanylate cyclase/phosphodiesterase [Sulfurovum sp.]